MQPYRQRKLRVSPLWQCLTRHFATFLAAYESLFQPRYGFLRPIIPDVVGNPDAEMVSRIGSHLVAQ